ncbi:hypothetical protein D3C84_1244090 [compost metagenome]
MKETSKATADGWPKFLKSMTAFGYTDPASNLHYSPVTPIKVDAAPADGSWLHSQMAAGLIGEV